MLIKTRASSVGDYDNKYPNIGIAYNDIILKDQVTNDINFLMDFMNSTSKVSFTSTYQDKDFILIAKNVCGILQKILTRYVNPIITNNSKTLLPYIIFSDRRIGLLGLTDSHYEPEYAFNVPALKNSIDVSNLVVHQKDYAEFHNVFWDYADRFIQYVNENNFTARNIIWYADKGRYVELAPKINECPEYLNEVDKLIKNSAYINRPTDEIKKYVSFIEVVR